MPEPTIEEKMLILQAGTADLANVQFQLMMQMALKLNAIAESVHASEKEIYLTIPDGGGLYTLEAGATTIDFEFGKIIQPDGTEVPLRTGLKVQGLPVMRSFLLTTAGDLQFSIDGQGFYTLGAGERYSARGLQFKQLYIDTNTQTYIKLIAATIPEMTTMYDRFLSADFESTFGSVKQELYSADETAAQMVFEDFGSVGKLTVEVFAKADVATNFYLEASTDNSHWFSIEGVTGVTDWHTGYLNSVEYVRLRSDAAGAPGNKVSLILSASR